jgi:hypothetical protein
MAPIRTTPKSFNSSHQNRKGCRSKWGGGAAMCTAEILNHPCRRWVTSGAGSRPKAAAHVCFCFDCGLDYARQQNVALCQYATYAPQCKSASGSRVAGSGIASQRVIYGLNDFKNHRYEVGSQTIIIAEGSDETVCIGWGRSRAPPGHDWRRGRSILRWGPPALSRA